MNVPPPIDHDFLDTVEQEIQKLLDSNRSIRKAELIISNASPVSHVAESLIPAGVFACQYDIGAFTICRMEQGRRPVGVQEHAARSDATAGIVRTADHFYQGQDPYYQGSFWKRIGLRPRDRYGKLVVWPASEVSYEEALSTCETIGERLSNKTYAHLEQASETGRRKMVVALRDAMIWRKALDVGCHTLMSLLPRINEVLFFGRIAGSDEFGLVSGATSQCRSLIRYSRDSSVHGRLPRLCGVGELARRDARCYRVRARANKTVAGLAVRSCGVWRPLVLKNAGKTIWNDEDRAIIALPVLSPNSRRVAGVFLVGRSRDCDGFWGCDELLIREATHELMEWVFQKKLHSDLERVMPYIRHIMELPRSKDSDFDRAFPLRSVPATDLALETAEKLRQEVRRCPSFRAMQHLVQTQLKQGRYPVYGDDFTSDGER